jgi:hypothetical protein
MRRSFTRLWAIALLATAFAAPQVGAQDKMRLRALEYAIESSTDAILLPGSQPGTLTFRDCALPCKVPSLEVSAQSAFFIGGTQVTLADFAAYVRRTGPQPLTVFHQPGRMTVTRITVVGQVN